MDVSPQRLGRGPYLVRGLYSMDLIPWTLSRGPEAVDRGPWTVVRTHNFPFPSYRLADPMPARKVMNFVSNTQRS